MCAPIDGNAGNNIIVTTDTIDHDIKDAKLPDVYRIGSLGIDIVLKPLPIFVTKEIHRATKEINKTITRTGKAFAVMQAQIEDLAKKYSEGTISATEFVAKTSALTEELQNQTPEDMDERCASSLLEICRIVFGFYDHNFTNAQLEQKMDFPSVLELLRTQLNKNNANDMLLAPARALVSIIERAPDEVAKLASVIK